MLQAGQCGFTLQTLCRATLAWRLGWDGWDWKQGAQVTGSPDMSVLWILAKRLQTIESQNEHGVREKLNEGLA